MIKVEIDPNAGWTAKQYLIYSMLSNVEMIADRAQILKEQVKCLGKYESTSTTQMAKLLDVLVKLAAEIDIDLSDQL